RSRPRWRFARMAGVEQCARRTENAADRCRQSRRHSAGDGCGDCAVAEAVAARRSCIERRSEDALRNVRAIVLSQPVRLALLRCEGVYGFGLRGVSRGWICRALRGRVRPEVLHTFANTVFIRAVWGSLTMTMEIFGRGWFSPQDTVALGRIYGGLRRRDRKSVV